MRFFGYLVLFALLGYALWPYYTVYQLDGAIKQPGTAALGELVDLAALRANYKQRLAADTKAILPLDTLDALDALDENSGFMGLIRQNVERLGDSALNQIVTLDLVHDTLRKAVTKATGQSPPYLMAGISFAFFESYNRFLIRIGDLGDNPMHVRLSLIGTEWKITDIVQ